MPCQQVAARRLAGAPARRVLEAELCFLEILRADNCRCRVLDFDPFRLVLWLDPALTPTEWDATRSSEVGHTHIHGIQNQAADGESVPLRAALTRDALFVEDDRNAVDGLALAN